MRALKRLNAIADLIDSANVVADIGCDHGYLGKMLIKSGKAEKIIAIDLKSQSLAKAEKLAYKCHIQDRVEFRLGDGVFPLQDCEGDTIVIAGLGGHTIVDILKQKELVGVKEYIFQPAQKSDFLKRYLQENKFKIICDFIVKDKNKFYNTIKAVKSEKNIKLSAEEILFCDRKECINGDGKNLVSLQEIEIAKKLKNKILNKDIEKCKK